MLLTKAQGQRFFNIFDALITYANERLGCQAQVFDPKTRRRDSDQQAHVATELWQHPEIIEEFADTNPFNLPKQDIDCARLWTQSHTGFYFVTHEKGRDLFLQDNYAFEVVGLSQEISTMLTSIPATVKATLLPFDDLVIYGASLAELPMHIGSSLHEALQASLEDAKLNNRVVTSASEFLRITPLIREERIQRQTAEMIDDLEAEMNGEEYPAGIHRGILAGLTEQERESHITAHLQALYPTAHQTLVERLTSSCTKGEPTTSLVEAFMRSTKQELIDAAEELDVFTGLRSKNKTELAQFLSAHFLICFSSPDALTIGLTVMGRKAFDSIRTLCAAKGQLEIQKDKLAELSNVPIAHAPFIFVFNTKDSFTFVMPQEVYELCKTVDWDAVEKANEDEKFAINVANKLTDLCGIVSLDNAVNEYERLMKEPCDTDFFIDCVVRNLYSDLCEYGSLDTDNTTYLLHYELAQDYVEQGGINLADHASWQDETDPPYLLEGKLDEYLNYLAACQQEKPIRTLSQEILDAPSVFDWKCSFPAVKALRNFLDAHVPDDNDDLAFADNIVEELVDATRYGLDISSVLKYLEEQSLILDDRNLQKMLNLISNLSNSLPRWDNSGWSPNELLEQETGHKLFLNEDGSPQKVGRNDPCPCGSGKKYKKCCG